MRPSRRERAKHVQRRSFARTQMSEKGVEQAPDMYGTNMCGKQTSLTGSSDW